MIQAGGKEREVAWKYMFLNWRTKYAYKILKNGGTNDDVDSAFAEVAIPFENRILNRNLPLPDNFSNYLQICIYNCWTKSKIKATKFSFENIEILHMSDDIFLTDNYNNTELTNIVDFVLNSMSEKCKKILTLFSEGYKMAEIALAMGYRDDLKAKKEKYLCQIKLTEFLNQNPQISELLKLHWNERK